MSVPHGSADSQAVVDSIRRIVHALEVGSHAAQRSTGLSGAQLFVLQTLAAGGAMSVTELAERSHTHQSSVSVVVSRLVQARLIQRNASLNDGRSCELSATKAGSRVLESGFTTPQQRLIEALDELTPTRLAQFRSILEEVVSLCGMDLKTPPMFFEGTKPEGKNS